MYTIQMNYRAQEVAVMSCVFGWLHSTELIAGASGIGFAYPGVKDD